MWKLLRIKQILKSRGCSFLEEKKQVLKSWGCFVIKKSLVHVVAKQIKEYLLTEKLKNVLSKKAILITEYENHKFFNP
jgi:hypothetical protein